MLPTTLIWLLFSVVVQCDAFHIPLEGRPRPRRAANRLTARANIFGESDLRDSQDLTYFTHLTLGSQDFEVVVDTGSSDLWVVGPVNGATDTGKGATLQYAQGKVDGPIKTTQLKFANYTIPQQAYLDADKAAAVGFPSGETGIIGLGPSSLSIILQNMGTVAAGDPPLDNIFKQNTSTPNFLSILLGRANVGADSFPGDLTVGSVLPGYEEIANEPKLDVAVVTTNTSQHWSVLLDQNGIIGPNGTVIPFSSGVAGSQSGRAVCVLDSGFSLPQVPASVAQALYASVPGAQLTQTAGAGSSSIWQVPCDAELDIAFMFGGKRFPVHPLDAVVQQGDRCVGAFQPVSFSFGGENQFDFIMGMAFLRNAYTLINFGDFVDGAASNTAPPFVQMLSTTNDTTRAHNEFQAARKAASSHPFTVKSGVVLALVIVGALLLMVAAACGLRYCRRRQRKERQPLGWRKQLEFEPDVRIY